MSTIKKTSTADHVDNHKRFIVFALLLLSFIYAAKVVMYVVDGEVDRYLRMLQFALAGLMAAVLIGSIYWKIRFIPKNQRNLFSSSDSYVMLALSRACIISWTLTFMCLSLIMVTTSKESSAFPTEFYLSLILFVMLAAFSVSFFFLFRSDKEDEIEEGVNE